MRSLGAGRWIVPALLAGLTGARAAPLSVALAASDPALRCGAAVTPTLRLTGTLPRGTRSLALIVWDEQPTALSGRWTVFDLPLGTTTLAAQPLRTASIAGGKVATNEAGHLGFSPPCGKGRHDLYVDLYALDVPSLNLAVGALLQTVHVVIKRHKLLEAKVHVVRVNR